MAITGPSMGLKIWNLLTDPYDHAQLADNWAKVEQHDHTEGKGVQIPTGGIANGAVSAAKLSPVTFEKAASEALATTTSFVDIVGCTITTTSVGTYLVTGTFDIASEGTTNTAIGALVVDGAVQTSQVNWAATASGQRTTLTGVWLVKSLASGKIIKLQAKKSGGTYKVETIHTKIIAYQIG